MKSVFLSAGHSTTDPGAVGNGLKEADVAVEIRNLVAVALGAKGIPYEVDSRGLGNLPLKDSIPKAKKYPIAIEFHCNASGNPAATGVETLSGPKDMKLGANISSVISGVLGIKNRGAKPENAGQHHRLGFVQAGGIIVELFFISNPADVKAYQKNKLLLAAEIAKELARASIT